MTLEASVSRTSFETNESSPKLLAISRTVFARQCGEEFRENSVTGTADKTVRRPNRQLVASVLLKLADVVERSTIKTGRCGRPDTVLDIRSADAGEERRAPAAGITPEDRVGDVNKVMRIECNVNIIKLVFKTPDHCRQARHIVLRAGHVQSPSLGIAKVHLGIYDQ